MRQAAIFALAVLTLFVCGCKRSGDTPTATEEPRVTQVPEVNYTVSSIVRYWPEDADYETCDYACIAQVPQFSKEHTSGYAMNKAVDEYLEKLSERIEGEYMPAASEKPPYSEVTFEYKYVNGVVNIVFIEKHCYQAVPYTETHVIMLDETGERITIADVLMNYHPDILISEALSNKLSGQSGYFGTDAQELFALINAKEGVCATETGCRVFIPEGRIASEQEGELSFDLTFEELLPGLLGENGSMTLEEYRGAVRLLRCCAVSLAARGGSFEGGATDPYTATGFMGQAVTELKIIPSAGRITVPEQEFLELYRACTGTEFPGIDTDAHSIKAQEGAYSVLAKQPEYVYNVDIISASREGDLLTIDGDVMFGSFGYASSEYVSHVRAVLIKSAESPYGWAISDFIQSL